MEERYEDVPYEQVLIVHDYWDGPRSGISYFNGTLHHFMWTWDDALDSYAARSVLRPISPTTLAFAQERHAIFARWDAARTRGEVTWTPGERWHPVLPSDAVRHEEIEVHFQSIITDSSGAHTKAIGDFRRTSDGHGPYGPWEVHWVVNVP